MVDTAVRPRPDFRTFLQSDTNTKGDALSVYEYKRQLRAKKVTLLQEKQAQRRVPGYKLPTNYHHQQQPNAVTGIVKREPVKKTNAVVQTAEITPAALNEKETEEQQQPGTKFSYLFSREWVFKGKSVVAPAGVPYLMAHNKAGDTTQRETRQIKSAKEHAIPDTAHDTEDARPKTAHAQPRLWRMGQPTADRDESTKEGTGQVSVRASPRVTGHHHKCCGGVMRK